jgi:hypothetical protein
MCVTRKLHFSWWKAVLKIYAGAQKRPAGTQQTWFVFENRKNLFSVLCLLFYLSFILWAAHKNWNRPRNLLLTNFFHMQCGYGSIFPSKSYSLECETRRQQRLVCPNPFWSAKQSHADFVSNNLAKLKSWQNFI